MADEVFLGVLLLIMAPLATTQVSACQTAYDAVRETSCSFTDLHHALLWAWVSPVWLHRSVTQWPRWNNQAHWENRTWTMLSSWRKIDLSVTTQSDTDQRPKLFCCEIAQCWFVRQPVDAHVSVCVHVLRTCVFVWCACACVRVCICMFACVRLLQSQSPEVTSSVRTSEVVSSSECVPPSLERVSQHQPKISDYSTEGLLRPRTQVSRFASWTLWMIFSQTNFDAKL